MKKNLFAKLLKYSAAVALALTFININTLCFATGHQPAPPKSALKLKK